MPNEAPQTITIKWHINQVLLISEFRLKNTDNNKINSIISSISNRKERKWDRFTNSFTITIQIIIKVRTIYFLYVVLNTIINKI